MKYVKAGFITSALALTLAATPVFAQSAAGNWELSLDTPQGAQTLTLALKVDGEKVTGDLSSPMGSVPVEGTLKGGALSVTANIDAQGMTLPLTFSGTPAGDVFNGSVKAGDFGEFPFSGKRVGGAAATAAAAPRPAAAPAAAASGGGATGKWDVVFTLEGVGDVPATAMLTQDGMKLTGTFSSQAGEATLNGTVTGQALKLEMNVDSPQGPMQVQMTGDLAGDTINGKATIVGLGDATWKATRAK